MRLAERFRGHANESALLAIVAGETPSAHVSSCAACQARLEALRAWTAAAAAEAGAIADEVFTPERLAAQKQQVLSRLEALGRSARVIAFPIGTPVSARSRASDIVRWAAAAAVGGIMVGLASGRLLDRHLAPAAQNQNSARTGPAGSPAEPDAAAVTGLDEAALLDAAYDRVSLGAIETIDDMTPRAREVALASLPRAPR